MKNIVLAFSGKIASGKSTISSEIADHFNWPRVSFGEFVRKRASELNLDSSREVLQELGARLLEEDPIAFCSQVISQSTWSLGAPLIIDGVRHTKLIPILKSLVFPAEFRLIYINLDDGIRQERFEQRTENLNNLITIEKHSTELYITDLISLSDLVVDGSKTISEIKAIIIGWIKSI